MRKLLIVPDCHVPFHSRAAWRILIKAAQHLVPDIIVVLGDFLDFEQVSSHARNPLHRNRIEDDLEVARGMLAELANTSPKSERHFLEGNHEERMQRYLWKSAPELAGIDELQVKNLLDLPRLGYRFTPYRNHVKIGKAFFTHDAGSAGEAAISRARSKFEHSVAIGHVHRMGVVYRGNAVGECRFGMSFGWLGSPAAAAYMHDISRRTEWQLGFGHGEILSNNDTHLRPVPIVNGRCIINGEIIQ